MTIGRVEYSPDYKSEKPSFEFSGIPPNSDDRIAFIADPLAAERARLEREVIEAAKKWVGFYNGSSLFFSDTKLADVVNDLLEFESNHGL